MMIVVVEQDVSQEVCQVSKFENFWKPSQCLKFHNYKCLTLTRTLLKLVGKSRRFPESKLNLKKIESNAIGRDAAGPRPLNDEKTSHLSL